MFTVRRLDPDEWEILRNADDGFSPDPKRSVAVVAFNGSGEVVGRTFLVAPAHIEGTWVSVSARSGWVLKMLMDKIEEEAKREGITQILSFANDAKVAEYLQRLGYTKMPLTVWEKKCQ